MWYTARKVCGLADPRKERHNEEKGVFGRRGFAEYQLGGVPEDHEKSGRKAEKRKKAEIVQTAPFGCAEGGSGCRKSQRLFRQPGKDGVSRPFAAYTPYVKGKLLYFWRYCPHTCGQEVML